jgi:hypothetical protein
MQINYSNLSSGAYYKFANLGYMSIYSYNQGLGVNIASRSANTLFGVNFNNGDLFRFSVNVASASRTTQQFVAKCYIWNVTILV